MINYHPRGSDGSAFPLRSAKGDIGRIHFKTIILANFIAEGAHMSAHISAHMAARYNITVERHSQIADNHRQVIQVRIPPLDTVWVAIFQIVKEAAQASVIFIFTQYLRRAIGIQASPFATITFLPAGDNNHMSDFAALKIISQVQLSVLVNRAAYGIIQGNINRVFPHVALFGISRQVGVISKHHIAGYILAKLPKFHIFHPKGMGFDQHFLALINDTRQGNPHPDELVVRVRTDLILFNEILDDFASSNLKKAQK